MPRSCVHLGLEERRRLHRRRETKTPVAATAAALGRHRSTIHREIRRNWWHDAEVPQASGYWPLTAEKLAERRRHASCKLVRHAEPRAAAINRLRAGRSPRQIAGRLRIEPAARHRLCHETIHETIHRFVYSPQGQSEERARSWRGICRSGGAGGGRGSAGSREAPCLLIARPSGTVPPR